MKTLNVATVFSGIGAFEQALSKLGLRYKILFACDNGERELGKTKSEVLDQYRESNQEISLEAFVSKLYSSLKKENWMKKSYTANYELEQGKWFEDIRFIDGRPYQNQVDFFVGGSPCQSFSIIGKKAGLDDVRGTLFYEYARLISEIRPRVFIYENVPGMLVHDKGNTWKVIKDVFESLGYKTYYKVLNSKDYGIPQDRRRLFVVGFRDGNRLFNFPRPIKLEKTLFDYLEPNVAARFYLGKKGFEFVTNPKYKNRARVNRPIIQTEKANQQFNWNGDFVFEPLSPRHSKEILERAFIGNYEGQKGVIRQLTHRECLRLMGFPDTFKIVPPNVWAYRQAGNSIVVDVLCHLVKEILNDD